MFLCDRELKFANFYGFLIMVGNSLITYMDHSTIYENTWKIAAMPGKRLDGLMGPD